MKKLFVLLCLVFSLETLHSLEGDFGIGLGILGVGMTTDDGEVDGFYYGNLCNFTWRADCGLSVTVSLPNFSLSIPNGDLLTLTFFNASVFYNLFNFSAGLRDDLRLGPFTAINALNYNDSHFFKFRSGLMFSWSAINFGNFLTKNSFFDFDLVNIELGYKYDPVHKHGFYAQIGFDLLTVMWVLTSGQEDEYEKYQRENPRY